MGQASPFKPTALVIETDEIEREMVATLLEESEMGVIQCESADVAVRVLEKMGSSLAMIFIDGNLNGTLDAVELAHFARTNYPNIYVIVTSEDAVSKALPEGTKFMAKPWIALDVLREAERSMVEKNLFGRRL
jgi:two-component system, cell cycle response regulator CpdR